MSSNDLHENRLKQVSQGWKDLGKWLLVDEAAEMLGVSRRTVYTYLKENKIQSIKSRGRRLVTTGSVVGFLLQQKVIEINNLKEDELKKEGLSHLKSEKWKRKIRKERSQGLHL